MIRVSTLICLLALPAARQPAGAQTVVVTRGVPHASFGAVAPADFDGDGDTDILVMGQNLQGEPVTGLFTFTERLVEPIPRSAPRIVASYAPFAFTSRRMKAGHAEWADMDGDGDPDLLVTGTGVDDIDINNRVEQPATDLFVNEGGRTLIIREGTGLPPLERSHAAWADIDEDGDLDLAIGGIGVDGAPFLGVFEHDGMFGFTPIAATTTAPSDLDWGDMDGDGDTDLLVVGRQNEEPVVYVLDNQDGQMVRLPIDIEPGLFARAAVGDYDRDGDADIFMTSGTITPALVSGRSVLYRVDGSQLTEVQLPVSEAFGGDVEWGDYDGDGDLDLLAAGIENLERTDNQRIKVLAQLSDGSFFSVLDIQGVLFGPTTWYDYNGDGRLDVYMTGIQDNKLITTIFEL